jgi:hypothetical protein
MPLEKRQLVLSDEELLHALSAYRNMSAAFLPQGEILRVSVAAEPGSGPGDGAVVIVGIRMCYGSGQQEIDVPLRGTDILSLLVRFCLENNVPIPRAGTKAAGAIDGKLALMIEYDHTRFGCVECKDTVRDTTTARGGHTPG